MTTISSLTALTGAGVDGAADLLPIVDMSAAGVLRNKKILVNELKISFGLAGTNSGDQTITLTGDVTGSGTGSFAATIANNAVTFGKVVAAASAGVVWASGAGNYAHNASGGGSTNFLRADGTWAAPPGTGGFTAASTTEVLTGTDSSKGVTPDALAALWEQGSDVASSGTISIGEGGYFHVTGTTTITDIDFATDKAGRTAWVEFTGILTLTHNASTLILPTGANITTAAGDTACFVSEGSDAVRCVAYNRASGAALAAGATVDPYEASPSSIPNLSAFTTWRNQGSASITADAYGVYFTGDNDSELHIYEQNLPATPFSYYARVRHQMYSNQAVTTQIFNQCGFAIVNSTSGRVLTCEVGAERVAGDETPDYYYQIERFSSVTVQNAIALGSFRSVVPLAWLRIDVTSTGVTLFGSVDGRRWDSLGTEAFATYLTASGGTADKLGIYHRAGTNATSTRFIFDVLQPTAP